MEACARHKVEQRVYVDKFVIFTSEYKCESINESYCSISCKEYSSEMWFCHLELFPVRHLVEGSGVATRVRNILVSAPSGVWNPWLEEPRSP